MLSKEEVLRLIAKKDDGSIIRTIWSSRLDWFGKVICAFSNDLDDTKVPYYLMIGVNAKTCKPSGLKLREKTLLKIAELRWNGSIFPEPAMAVYHSALEGGDVIIVEVHPASCTPVRFKGSTWVKSGDKIVRAVDEQERRLIAKRTCQCVKFEEIPCPTATLDDLDLQLFFHTYLKETKDKHVSQEDNLELKKELAAMKFYSLEADCPTNGGMLSLGKKNKYFFPGVCVKSGQ